MLGEMTDSLIIIFGLSLIPLLMLAAAVGFARRYRRATARSMGISLNPRSSLAKAPAILGHDSLLRRLQDIDRLAGVASDALDVQGALPLEVVSHLSHPVFRSSF